MKTAATLAVVALLTACGDKDGDDSAATDGTDGTTDGADGGTDGTDGTDGTADGTDGTAASSYAADVQPIVEANCVFCHGPGGSASWMDLASDGASALVDVPSGQVGSLDRVEPGDPSSSYLWLKVNDTHTDAGGTGDVMPPRGPLDASDLATIEAWITAGANP